MAEAVVPLKTEVASGLSHGIWLADERYLTLDNLHFRRA